MPIYTYGRIARLQSSLLTAGVDPSVVDRIMEGGEAIVPATKPEKKAAWLRGAMDRMDEMIDPELRQAVREKCACCLGGKRLQASTAIAKSGKPLADRVKAFDESGVGGKVMLLPDGSISACFFEGPGPYRCPCLPKSTEPLSVTYCQCCGGHIKHHLQIALQKKLSVEVKSSVLSSGGEKPCVFHLKVEE